MHKIQSGIEGPHRGGMINHAVHGNIAPAGNSMQVYGYARNDDNFPLKTNVENTQFGFLPSILKSFQ